MKKKYSCKFLFLVLMLLVSAKGIAQNSVSSDNGIITVSLSSEDKDTGITSFDSKTIFISNNTDIIIIEGTHVFGDIKKIEPPFLPKKTFAKKRNIEIRSKSDKELEQIKKIERQIAKDVKENLQQIGDILVPGTDKTTHTISLAGGGAAVSPPVLKHYKTGIASCEYFEKTSEYFSGYAPYIVYETIHSTVLYYTILFARPPTQKYSI